MIAAAIADGLRLEKVGVGSAVHRGEVPGAKTRGARGAAMCGGAGIFGARFTVDVGAHAGPATVFVELIAVRTCGQIIRRRNLTPRWLLRLNELAFAGLAAVFIDFEAPVWRALARALRIAAGCAHGLADACIAAVFVEFEGVTRRAISHAQLILAGGRRVVARVHVGVDRHVFALGERRTRVATPIVAADGAHVGGAKGCGVARLAERLAELDAPGERQSHEKENREK